MKKFYDRKLRGFVSQTHAEAKKNDCCKVEEARFIELLQGQEAGMEIVPDLDGHPILISRASLKTKAELHKDLLSMAMYVKTLGVKSTGKWFPTDLSSREFYQSLKISIPNGIRIPAMDGTLETLTADKLSELTADIEAFDADILANFAALQNEIETSETPQDVDLTTGWPERFSLGSIL